MQPFFLVHMWNVHEKIIAGMSNPNNATEGLAQGFSSTIAADHPSSFHLMAVILKEHNNTETSLAQVNVGLQVTEHGQARYAQLTARLQTLLHQYDLGQ
jgi:hypothetical protein